MVLQLLSAYPDAAQAFFDIKKNILISSPLRLILELEANFTLPRPPTCVLVQLNDGERDLNMELMHKTN